MEAARLTERIAAANAGGRIGLIPFVTAGYPGREAFWEILEELDRTGADILEIGVPFSDPVADGPVVEAASQIALANGTTLSGILRGLAERRGRYAAPLVLMGYYNPFLQRGLRAFAAEAGAAGVAGCIVPDLPLEESGPLREALETEGIALIPLVGLNTGAERMAAYARSARGYAYLVSVLGVTGERGGFPPELTAALDRAQKAFSVPLALGFGLSRPEQLEDLPARPQAVVFGSALLTHIQSGRKASDFLARWREPVPGPGGSRE
ncbi:MAG: tryptophan synthase subunit alpha [Desulfovibrio sp.]|jgi:tryptophan synthase alpha chain|nr:tryptophan synthase subunit alpha [Desulfovibrio sp.]